MYPALTVFDLEGVFTPEVWISVAERTGIPELRRTTRDEPDYDKLMRGRIRILAEHGLRLADIQAVIAGMDPLPGAVAFLRWIQTQTPVIILSDTYYEFAGPLIAKLGYPTLFCNTLEVDERGMIVGYRLRIANGKYEAVRALKSIHFRVIAVGDSYNDMAMLTAADYGILFRPPANVIAEFPQFPVTTTYEELQAHLEKIIGGA